MSIRPLYKQMSTTKMRIQIWNSEAKCATCDVFVTSTHLNGCSNMSLACRAKYAIDTAFFYCTLHMHTRAQTILMCHTVQINHLFYRLFCVFPFHFVVIVFIIISSFFCAICIWFFGCFVWNARWILSVDSQLSVDLLIIVCKNNNFRYGGGTHAVRVCVCVAVKVGHRI